ncbi:MFS transporter [Calorimonas adulescens]|uniref:MFS transporter n=2 Tax=Calorimonas adulescens TaxID=2606906 RepID=A0A5D8Q754_9THEO|nr:MFS transporter [Calorimonas adulescens]
MSIYFIAMGIGTITPAIQNIAEAFPQIDFTTILLVSTLPSLFIIPSTVLAGMLAGNKMRYKTLLIVGILLFVIAGTAPAFMNDFTAILISRAVFGIGLGIISPLGNALILKLFDGQERANMLGLSTIVMNIGGIVLQMLGAILCSINWHYAFLAHLLGIISLVIVLFMLPEPEREVQAAGEKIKMPTVIYIISLLFGIATMLNYPMLVNMSTIIITGNLGNAASAGVVLSMFTVGGMVAGAIFGKLYQYTNRFAISVGLLIVSIGAGFVYYANNLVLLTVGATLVGIGFSIVMPAVMMIIGMVVPPAGFAAASGILMAFMNLGGFVSPYYIDLLAKISGQDPVRFPIFFEMVVYGIAAAVYTLARLKAPAATAGPGA